MVFPRSNVTNMDHTPCLLFCQLYAFHIDRSSDHQICLFNLINGTLQAVGLLIFVSYVLTSYSSSFEQNSRSVRLLLGLKDRNFGVQLRPVYIFYALAAMLFYSCSIITYVVEGDVYMPASQ